MPSAIFSPEQALELGKFTLAAYTLYSKPTAFSVSDGYTVLEKLYADDITDGLPDYVSFGFIARKGGDVVVAIRGTEGVFEWVKDIEFFLDPCPFFNAGKTERGFTSMYSTLRVGADRTATHVIDVLKKLTSDGSVNSLRITGHSLGAGLATLLALDVTGNNIFKTPVVYTFASPRVGDKVFAGTLDGFVETHWRVANLNDIVPHLPPQLLGYHHADAELPINTDDRTRHTVSCQHALETYLNTIDPTFPLGPEASTVANQTVG